MQMLSPPVISKYPQFCSDLLGTLAAYQQPRKQVHTCNTAEDALLEFECALSYSLRI